MQPEESEAFSSLTEEGLMHAVLKTLAGLPYDRTITSCFILLCPLIELHPSRVWIFFPIACGNLHLNSSLVQAGSRSPASATSHSAMTSIW
jgi:hypothetical protein